MKTLKVRPGIRRKCIEEVMNADFRPITEFFLRPIFTIVLAGVDSSGCGGEKL